MPTEEERKQAAYLRELADLKAKYDKPYAEVVITREQADRLDPPYKAGDIAWCVMDNENQTALLRQFNGEKWTRVRGSMNGIGTDNYARIEVIPTVPVGHIVLPSSLVNSDMPSAHDALAGINYLTSTGPSAFPPLHQPVA